MIPYGRQNINEGDIGAVISALRSDWLTTGPLVEDFENLLSESIGAPTIVVSSGTAALHCAFAAIGVKPDDEIITPPITFIATQATAMLFGAKIVFADIQLDSGNIDPNQIEKLITARTKAIVAVDFAGHPCDLDLLKSIADKHNIFLIEDAAHSLGSTYRGRKVGSIAHLTTFSFYPTKNITTGEGGAVSSIDLELLNKASRFARQGVVREFGLDSKINKEPWYYEVSEPGLNYRLTDLQCALGISQIKRIDSFMKSKNEIFDYYNHFFSKLNLVTVPQKREYVDVNWHLYPIHVPSENRLQIFNFLRQNDIGVQVNYIPAYRHPVFKEYKIDYGNFPNSENFYKTEISLPMSAWLNQSHIDKVVKIFSAAHRKFIG